MERSRLVVVVAVGIAAVAVAAPLAHAGQDEEDGAAGHEGLVSSIAAAPVTPDGTVTGRVTDIVIDLVGSKDPSVPGRTLLAGRQIRVQLPEGFAPVEPPLPFPVPAGPGCPIPPAGTPLGTCNLVVLLQGWPQRPILPFSAISTVYDAAASTITITANQDIVASPPATPGIKQIHLLLSGFRNPGAGHYALRVEAETGPAGELETRTGTVHIIPHARPSIGLTSVFNPGRPSPIHQETEPGQETPVPYDLLLWGEDGRPLTGVTVVARSPHLFQLVQGTRIVGHIHVSGPPRATGHDLFAASLSAEIATPLTGVATARLNVRFRAGSVSGDYALAFELAGGNSVRAFVRVR